MVNIGAVIFGSIFAFIGGGVVWQRLDRLRQVGELSTENVTPVRDLQPDTWALVEGTVRRADDDPFPAHIDGTEGYVVTTTLEWDAEQVETFHPFHRQLDGVPFDLDDGNRSVRIEPPLDMVEYAWGNDELTVQGDVETPEAEYVLDETVLTNDDGVPETVGTWIETRGEGLDELPTGGGLRFRQGTVEPDESVLVYGRVRHRSESPTDGPAMVLDGGDTPERFVLTDKSGEDAKIDVQQVEYRQLIFGVVGLLVGLAFIVLGIVGI